VFRGYKSRRTFFWRAPQKDEVDIVVEDGEPMPVEVKYRSQVTRDDVKSVLKFCRRFGAKKAIVVTRNRLDAERIGDNEIMYVPAWLFMLAI
jgi:predicted AAA+ superfamily ATPase